MHENLLVRQISFEHPFLRESHLYRHRILVQLEDSNVLELVALFLANVNLAPGKLVNDLIASKERHRISRGQIENRAAQFFLRSRRSLHVEPETDCRAADRDRAQRNADARNAHAIAAQRGVPTKTSKIC